MKLLPLLLITTLTFGLYSCHNKDVVNPVPEKMVAVTPSSKLLYANEDINELVAVRLIYNDSIPVEGINVTFKITQGNGVLSNENFSTDENGIGYTYYSATENTDSKHVIIEASINEIDSKLLFEYSISSSYATKITQVSGNNQEALAGYMISNPLIVHVTDDFDNASKNYPVEFSIQTGNGELKSQIVNTDSEGNASVSIVKTGDNVIENIVIAKISDDTNTQFAFYSLYPTITHKLIKTKSSIGFSWDKSINHGFKQYIIHLSEDTGYGISDVILDSLDNIETLSYEYNEPLIGKNYKVKVDVQTESGTIVSGNWEDIDFGDFFEFDDYLHDIVIDSKRDLLYISLPNKNEVLVFDNQSRTVIFKILISSRPYGMDISWDQSKLYVALNASGAVAIVNLESGSYEYEKIDVYDAIGTYYTYDVVEGKDNRVYVSGHTGSGGDTYVGLIKLDDNNSVQRFFFSNTRDKPDLLVDRDNYLYVSQDYSKLFKLDISTDSATLVLYENLDVTLPGKILSKNGERLYFDWGEVVNTNDFSITGMSGQGLPFEGSSDNMIYYLSPFNIIGYDTQTLTKINEYNLRFDNLIQTRSYPEKNLVIIQNSNTTDKFRSPNRIYFVDIPF